MHWEGQLLEPYSVCVMNDHPPVRVLQDQLSLCNKYNSNLGPGLVAHIAADL